MALKTYSIRLDEKEYEKLKKFLGNYGDPDLSVNFILRTYIADLNKALPELKKSEWGVRNHLAFWGMTLKQLMRTSQIENIMQGEPIADRAKKEDSGDDGGKT